MKIIVFGSGSIAVRHIKNIIELSHSVTIQSDYQCANSLSFENKRIPIVRTASVEDFDAVVIANNTNKHMSTAIECASKNVPFFIEKPLSNSLDNINFLLEKVNENQVVVEAGYMLQAHSQVSKIKDVLIQKALGEVFYVRAAVGQWLPEWRPDRDYLKGYAAQECEGGGVLLDLIHEVELVQSLFGKIREKSIYRKKCEKLGLETEAIATINGLVNGDAICHIEMDYIRRKYKRELEIVGDLGSMFWDFSTQRLTISIAGKSDIIHDLDPLTHTRNDMYVDHMNHFISRVRNPHIKPISSLESSVLALETVLEKF